MTRHNPMLNDDIPRSRRDFEAFLRARGFSRSKALRLSMAMPRGENHPDEVFWESLKQVHVFLGRVCPHCGGVLPIGGTS